MVNFTLDDSHWQTKKIEASSGSHNSADVTFYSTSNLSPGSHTLVVNLTNNWDFWLDYVIVTPAGPSCSSESQSKTPIACDSTSSLLAPATTAQVIPTQSTSATTSQSEPYHSGGRAHMVTIAGVMIGGFLVLVSIATIWYLRRRRGRNHGKGICPVG